MKKEINELLKQEDGFLKINELFKLHRWQHTKEMDPTHLGRDIDCLELEMTNSYGRTRAASVRLESRAIPELQEEIEQAMRKMMSEYTDTLASSLKGGYLF